MSNAYVDPWDILNNFSFNVYTQKSLFIGEKDILTHASDIGIHWAGSQLKITEILLIWVPGF